MPGRPKSYCVYILRCKDGCYYTGVTSNLQTRLYHHSNGTFTKCFTYRRRPVELVFTKEFSEFMQAAEAEKQIKGWCRKKKEAIIEGRKEDLPPLAKKRRVKK